MNKACLFLLFCLAGSLALGLTASYDSGYFTLDLVPPELELIAPNGGEAWYIGDTNDILWTASDTNPDPNSVYLWYSLNGGADYIPIAEAIPNGGAYPWALPSSQSYNARVRVRIGDAFGNLSQRSSLAPFAITYVPPAPPDSVFISTLNARDAVISWLPVTQTIYGTPITPDGYLVLYNETPYEDDQYYYFLAEVDGTSYTHQNVAHWRDQMFYRVVAFKDYDGRMARLLERLRQDKDKPRPWSEIMKGLLSEGGVQ
jgi:hypothetical protein